MGGIDKIFAPLLGAPLISYSLRALHDIPQIEAIVLVLSPQSVHKGRELVESSGWTKVIDVRSGGRRRQDSVSNGLEGLPALDFVIVHDGARPMIDADMVARGIAEASRTGAAVAAVPVKDTIKVVDADMLVKDTPSRESLWAAQTPQVFRADLLREAHRSVSEDVTDDAAMVERIGGRVRLFMGSYENIKVTTPEDLSVAEAILRKRSPGVSGPTMSLP